MANWCSNWVNVSGDPKSVESFMNEIKELNEESIKNECGVSPLNPPEDGRYMFNLYIDNTDGFSFSTKWSPAFDSLRFLTQKHEVKVTNRYEELGCGIYGEWYCDTDGETDVYLEDDEIDTVVGVDEDYSIWEFEGEQSDFREDFLSIVLERKINGESCKSENS